MNIANQNPFSSARVKLTTWYTLVLILISICLSGLFYFRTARLISLRYLHITRRLSGQPGRMHQQKHYNSEFSLSNEQQEILDAEVTNTKKELLIQLAIINTLIAFFGAGASYFLSGRTLQPIKTMINKQQCFVTNAAHEFKTPLAALQASIEVSLLNQNLSESTIKLLQDNLDDTMRLTNLTNKLLKQSQVQNNNSSQHYKQINMTSLVKNVIKELSPLAKKKQIKIKNQQQLKNNSAVIVANPDTIKEVLSILLDNAIKYSHHNSHVELRLKEAMGYLLIEVEDQGIGIAEADLEHIFDRFYRTDSSRKYDKNDYSFGLGLSLAKQIIINHGGKIEVKSQPGKGSIFRVWLKQKI